MRPAETTLKILTWKGSIDTKRAQIKAKEKRFYELNKWMVSNSYSHPDWDKNSHEYMAIPGEIDVLQQQIWSMRHQKSITHTKYFTDSLAFI